MSTGFAGGGLCSLLSPALADDHGDGDLPILVVVHQAGGNDSLNTVVPYDTSESDHYYEARPNLGLAGTEVLPVGQGLGFHPSLSRLKGLWDEGELAIVNGVGYPNPHLSHFKNIDIWASASPEGNFDSGWLGRFFDHHCSSHSCNESFVAIESLERSTLTFRGQNVLTSLTMKDPAFFDFCSCGDSSEVPEGFDDFFAKALLQKLNHQSNPSDDPTLAYVRSTLDMALQSSTEIKQVVERSEKGTPVGAFPDSDLGRDLAKIAGYINGGANATTYFAVQGGYDTHGNQFVTDGAGRPLRGHHSSLLSDFDEAWWAFAQEMKRQRQWHRVLLMSFSEFSRKIPENGNKGTDHGAAGSLFFASGGVQPGFYGAMPDLAVEARIMNDSMAPSVDFRQVYRTVLERWMGLSGQASERILRIPEGSYPSIDFLAE